MMLGGHCLSRVGETIREMCVLVGGGGVIIEIGKVLARGGWEGIGSWWCPPEESVYKGLSLNHLSFCAGHVLA